MLFPHLSTELCGRLAREEFGNPKANKNKTDAALDKEICESLIGTTYEVAAELWNLIDPVTHCDKFSGAHPKHLFWSLLFLKNYCTEPVLIRVVGFVDKKTLQKWVWIFVRAIADLKPDVVSLLCVASPPLISKIIASLLLYKIIWIRRFEGWDGKTECVCTVDGVDCAIQEPWPFDEEIFSKKLNGPGYKYEICVCIKTGAIVWVNGPFKAGRHDKTIFVKEGLKDALCDDELLEGDMAYSGDMQLKNAKTAQTKNAKRSKGRARGHHENVNGELKKFEVVNSVFRHDPRKKHQMCFEAVAVICQLRHDFGRHRNITPEYDATYH